MLGNFNINLVHLLPSGISTNKHIPSYISYALCGCNYKQLTQFEDSLSRLIN